MKRPASLSLKVSGLLVLQTLGTLAAVTAYYAYLKTECETHRQAFTYIANEARTFHRRLDDPAPFGESGYGMTRAFHSRLEEAMTSLRSGGRVGGTNMPRLPAELSPLLEDIVQRWNRTRPALAALAAASEPDEKALRQKLHIVLPEWQAAVDRMEKSLARREGTIQRQLANVFGLIAAANVVFFLLLQLLFRKLIIRPVQAVQSAASRLAAGEYSARAPVPSGDEIGALAREFNNMGEQLEGTITALESSNRELEQYAYAAAHDLQEPLRVLALYSQLLERRCELPADAGQFLSEIRTNAERMQQLVAGLLSHSRSLHEAVTSQPADLNKAIESARAVLADEIASSGAILRYQQLPVVMADEAHMELVFRNLISNALKYRGTKRPEIDISAITDGEDCTVSVRDNGIGIDPAHHERIFGLFKRLHGREIPGTGIGLAVTKTLIERHGGRMWVESQAGRGSTFQFRLRLAQMGAPAASSA